MKKIIPSFSQLSGGQPLPPPPPGNNHGPLGMKMSPTAKRGIPPGIAGKSLSMSSIPVDRDIGNGIINGNGDDHNGYYTGTANGMMNSNHNVNCINFTQDDSKSLQDYGRGGSGGSNKGLHNGFLSSGSERITPDDSSSSSGNSNGYGGTRDLSRVLSPPQSVSVRPSFSRLSIAGPMHHSGEGYTLLDYKLLSLFTTYECEHFFHINTPFRSVYFLLSSTSTPSPYFSFFSFSLFFTSRLTKQCESFNLLITPLHVIK